MCSVQAIAGQSVFSKNCITGSPKVGGLSGTYIVPTHDLDIMVESFALQSSPIWVHDYIKKMKRRLKNEI